MQNVETVDYYFVNNRTMFILPNYDPIYQTKIFERERTILCKQTPIKIIDASCIRTGGATMDGRKRAIEIVTKKKVMIPIPVDPSKGIILMPTRKVKDPYCSWIAYCHVKDLEHVKGNPTETNVVFHNNQKHKVDIPLTRMQNQLMLAGHVFGYFLKDQFIS